MSLSEANAPLAIAHVRSPPLEQELHRWCQVTIARSVVVHHMTSLPEAIIPLMIASGRSSPLEQALGRKHASVHSPPLEWALHQKLQATQQIPLM